MLIVVRKLWILWVLWFQSDRDRVLCNNRLCRLIYREEFRRGREVSLTGYVIVTVHVTVCFTLLYIIIIIFDNLILLRISDDIELHFELLVQVRLNVRTTWLDWWNVYVVIAVELYMYLLSLNWITFALVFRIKRRSSIT